MATSLLVRRAMPLLTQLPNNTGVTSAQEPYQIEYCKRYEPWGIISRRLMPWFDERFRGYGRNKIVFVAALNATGFTCVRILRCFCMAEMLL